MELKGRVKYCFIKIFENNKSKPKYPVYDKVYHFSRDGRLILSRYMTYSSGGCGSTVLGNSTQAVVSKYKYYPNGTKAVLHYIEYYSRSFAMMDKELDNVEIYHAKGHSVKIHNLTVKQIETYDSLKRIRVKSYFSVSHNSINIQEHYTEYDTSMHISFLKKHYWNSKNVGIIDLKRIISLQILLNKKTFSDSTHHITYAFFNRRDSSMDTTTIFVPNPSHTTDTYKYDKYGSWIEKISKYGDHVKRKIEYW